MGILWVTFSCSNHIFMKRTDVGLMVGMLDGQPRRPVHQKVPVTVQKIYFLYTRSLGFLSPINMSTGFSWGTHIWLGLKRVRCPSLIGHN